MTYELIITLNILGFLFLCSDVNVREAAMRTERMTTTSETRDFHSTALVQLRAPRLISGIHLVEGGFPWRCSRRSIDIPVVLKLCSKFL